MIRSVKNTVFVIRRTMCNTEREKGKNRLICRKHEKCERREESQRKSSEASVEKSKN